MVSRRLRLWCKFNLARRVRRCRENENRFSLRDAAIFRVSLHRAAVLHSPSGNDANPGTLEKPFVTLQRAQQAVRQKHGDVFLRGGTYYLPRSEEHTSELQSRQYLV